MSTDQSTRCLARRNALALLILTVIFAFRVVAQLVQAWHPLRFLPPFEAWHSGALPYSWLVGTQVVIMAMCLRIVWKLLNNTIIPSLRKGRLLSVFGCIYLLGMCIRLFLGTTVASEHNWFGAILPTVFHLVLGAFVILYGRFHSLASQAFLEKQSGASA